MIKVAQCWDDGVYTDIKLTEILRKYNAKATFNLCPGLMADNAVKPHWHALDECGWSYQGFHGGRLGKNDLLEVYKGFQVASHCMHHEVAAQCDIATFKAGAVDAKKYLEDLFQRECPGFAWPCGGATEEAIEVLKENGFAYARTCENTTDVTKNTNPYRLASNCHFKDGLFWKKFQEAKANGVGAFYFWGHSYEMMDSPGLWQQFEDKIAAISADPDVVWVGVIDLVR